MNIKNKVTKRIKNESITGKTQGGYIGLILEQIRNSQEDVTMQNAMQVKMCLC